MRVASGGVVGLSLLLYVLLHEDDESSGGGVPLLTMSALGAGSFVFLTVHDIVDSYFAAKRVQEGLPSRKLFERGNKVQLSLLPTLVPGKSSATLGLSLGLKF